MGLPTSLLGRAGHGSNWIRLAWQAVLACLTLLAAPAVTPHDLGGGTSHAPDSAVLIGASWLRDPAGILDPAAVREADARGQMQPLRNHALSLGYSPDVLWLRLRLDTRDTEHLDWVLNVRPAYLDDVRLYLPEGAGFRMLQAGDAHPRRDSGRLNYRGNAFALTLPPGQHDLYVRVQTTSTLAVLFDIQSARQFANASQTEYIVIGAFYGAVLALIIANLVNWLVLRGRLFGYYVGCILIGMLQWFSMSGLSGQFIFPSSPHTDNALQVLLTCVHIGSAALFYAALMGLRRQAPRTFRLYQFVTVFAAVTGASVFFGAYQQLAPWLMGLSLAVIVAGLPPLLMLRTARGGMGAKLIILIAGLGFSIPAAWTLLVVLAVVPVTAMALDAPLIGGLIHAMAAHIAIAMRIRVVERARERAQAEAERQRKARIEQADLLAMIAHEVRTPIAIVDAAANSLRLIDVDPAAPRLEHYTRIAGAVQRINTLIELVVAQNRIDDAEWAIELGVIDPGELAASAIAALGAHGAGRVRLHVEPDLPALPGDPHMLRFALVNLLDNALKYSPETSIVDLIVNRLETPYLAWHVVDDGPGLTPDDEHPIFERYGRRDPATNQKTGIGLYLVRVIARRHAGNVSVTREPGRGARFTLCLPLEPRSPA